MGGRKIKAGSGNTDQIIFDEPFDGIPYVLVTANGYSSTYIFIYFAYNISKTGFSVGRNALNAYNFGVTGADEPYSLIAIY